MYVFELWGEIRFLGGNQPSTNHHASLLVINTIKKLKKQSLLMSKGINILPVDMAQLMDDLGLRSDYLEVSSSGGQSLPYSSVIRHPSCSLSDESMDAMSTTVLKSSFRLIMTYHHFKSHQLKERGV